jgi:hypothetical protein
MEFSHLFWLIAAQLLWKYPGRFLQMYLKNLGWGVDGDLLPDRFWQWLPRYPKALPSSRA